MTNLYIVTAGNISFYADLAVVADSENAAKALFNRFCSDTLAESTKIEIDYARSAMEEPDEVDDDEYEYGFDPADIEEHEKGDTISGYLGEIGRDVVITKSGSNG